MKIYVNNDPREFPAPLRIPELLETLQVLQAAGIALAVNDQVVPKMDWAQTELKENDRILILHATRGG